MSRQENVGGGGRAAFIYWRPAVSLALFQFYGTFHMVKTCECDGLLSEEELSLQEDRQHDKFRSETCRSLMFLKILL